MAQNGLSELVASTCEHVGLKVGLQVGLGLGLGLGLGVVGLRLGKSVSPFWLIGEVDGVEVGNVVGNVVVGVRVGENDGAW